MNNILYKPGMFGKALQQYLETGAIVNSDFHLQNLDYVYRAPTDFVMPDRSQVVTRPHARTYTLNNPVTIHSSHDQTTSATSKGSQTSSGSHSKTGSGSSTTTTTVTETPNPLGAQIKEFLRRTEGRNVDYDMVQGDMDLIAEIEDEADRTNGEFADYYDDLNEDGKLMLMLI